MNWVGDYLFNITKQNNSFQKKKKTKEKKER